MVVVAADQDQFARPAEVAEARQQRPVQRAELVQVQVVQRVAVEHQAVERLAVQHGQQRVRLTVLAAQVHVGKNKGAHEH